MKKKIAMIAAAGLLAPAIASADLSYNFIEAGYVLYDDVDGQDYDGYRIKGSAALTPDFFVFGEYSALSDDIDLDQFHIGVGYRMEVAPDTDVYGGVSFERAELEASTPLGKFSVEDNGFGLRAGARTLISEHFELKGELRYVNIRGDIDDDYFGLNLGAQFHVTHQLGLVLEYDNFDGEHGIIAGARFNF